MTAGLEPRPAGAGRLRATVAREAWRVAVAVTDLLPPRWRYGQLRRLTTALFGGGPLPAVSAAVSGARSSAAVSEPFMAVQPTGDRPLRCLLLTSGLDVGGVEQVVATLARGLPHEGIETMVFATAGGRTAEALRDAAVPVVISDDPEALADVLTASAPDVVQLHNAPLRLVQTVAGQGVPMVPVVHNMEIHRSPAQWVEVGDAWRTAVRTIAVSHVAARHHAAHLPGTRVPEVIPNGASSLVAEGLSGRAEARSSLAAVIGPVDDDDVVVLCLARYDAQKNVPGLVRAFDRAADEEPRLRLVVAGTVGDAMELRRAEAVRRAGRRPDRIHLLGASDASTLLAASDAFVLDSFIEGWPVAATEAAAVGLPLVLADAGGASELAAEGSTTAVIVANAAGPAELVDDSAVRAARRARHQPNERELADALVTVAAVRAERRASIPIELSEQVMLRCHAQVLRGVVQPPAEPSRADDGVPGAAR